MTYEIWHDQNEVLRHYFDMANGCLVPNQLAFLALKRKMKFYKMILDGEITFQQAVRSWLGISEIDVTAVQGMNFQEALMMFCEEHEGHELTDEEIRKLRTLVVTAADQVGLCKTRGDRQESVGRSALNNRISALSCPYRLAKDRWSILKVKEEAN